MECKENNDSKAISECQTIDVLREMQRLFASIKELKYVVYDVINHTIDYLEETEHKGNVYPRDMLEALASMRTDIETVTQEFNSVF